MKSNCTKTRELLNDYKNGSLKDFGIKKELEAHLRQCSACRDLALDKNLSALLNLSFNESPPDPAPSFFVNLSRKIEGIDRQEESGIFSEILMSASLKLVPAMAALLFIITATTALFYESSSANTGDYSLEEMILFDEGKIKSDTFLQEILKVEVQNGK